MKCVRRFDRKLKSIILVLFFIVLGLNALSLTVYATPNEDLLESINKGDIEAVKMALRDGADPNAKYKTGVTALMIAVRKGNLTMTELLISQHADINAVAQGGFTALMYAAYDGYIDIVKLLLAHDADATLQTARGKTALTIAEEKDYTDIIRILKENPTSEGNVELTAHDSRVKSMLFMPDGTMLITGGMDNIIRFWNVVDYTLAFELVSQHDSIRAIKISPGNKLLAAACYNGIEIWDISSKTLLRTIPQKEKEHIFFLEDGSKLGVWSYGEFKIYDVKNGSLIFERDDWSQQGFHGYDVIAFSPDFRRFVYGEGSINGGFLNLSDFNSGRIQPLSSKEILQGPVICSFAPNGQFFTTGHITGNIGIWDVSGKFIQVLRKHNSEITGLIFSDEGRKLISAGRDGCIYLWSMDTLKIIDSYQTQDLLPIEKMALSADSKILSFTCYEGKVFLWKLESSEKPKEIFRKIDKSSEEKEGTTITTQNTPTICQDAQDCFEQGNTYFEEEKYDRAIEYYTQSITLNPKVADAYFNRGDSYLMKEEYDRAIEDYTQVISLDPMAYNAFYNRGAVYYMEGKCVEAWQDLRQVQNLGQQIPPKFLEMLNTKCPTKGNSLACQDAKDCVKHGNTYVEKEEYDRAIEYYTQAITLNPKYAEAYAMRGNIYITKREFDRVIADCTQAITLNPKLAVAYSIRGMAYLENGKCAEAWQDVRQAQNLGFQSYPAFLEKLNTQCPKK